MPRFAVFIATFCFIKYFQHALRVLYDYKLSTIFQSVVLNSNKPIKFAHSQKLANQSKMQLTSSVLFIKAFYQIKHF